MRIMEVDLEQNQTKPEWWTYQDPVIVNMIGTLSASSPPLEVHFYLSGTALFEVITTATR